MSGKIFVWLLATVLQGIVSAQAQQPGRIPRIGFLTGQSPSEISARIEAFRRGLRELGYVEGKNIVIEWRSARGNFDHLPALATELVSLKVDVIVSYGPTPTRVVKKATSTMPIVMGLITTLLATDLLPALRDLAGTSPGYPPLRRK
jgi:ABC-type uncharacterized transport system substrate-binding protein